ncbi:hypothetical protein ACFV29_34945 [Streptomyces sp. NPDC059690]|uniref:hypothetical protein n=1 Tax=Streptomyces sp. NPDC059690 TaxID=3346907 RepID=UPI00367AA561
MRAEVLYSRLYMAGHVSCDLVAGTLLGDLIGDYELAVAGGWHLPRTRGPAAARHDRVAPPREPCAGPG